jgi:hypothetical protein
VQDQAKAAKKVALAKPSRRLHMKINQFVVMYLDTDEVVRPLAPPDVSPVKRYLVVLLLSFSWHSGALLYAKVQLLV